MMAPDTVCDYEPESGEGDGFTFRDYASEAMLAVLRRAVDLYLRDPGAWQSLMLRGMREDHSWGPRPGKYLKLYQRFAKGS